MCGVICCFLKKKKQPPQNSSSLNRNLAVDLYTVINLCLLIFHLNGLHLKSAHIILNATT